METKLTNAYSIHWIEKSKQKKVNSLFSLYVWFSNALLFIFIVNIYFYGDRIGTRQVHIKYRLDGSVNMRCNVECKANRSNLIFDFFVSLMVLSLFSSLATLRKKKIMYIVQWMH